MPPGLLLVLTLKRSLLGSMSANFVQQHNQQDQKMGRLVAETQTTLGSGCYDAAQSFFWAQNQTTGQSKARQEGPLWSVTGMLAQCDMQRAFYALCLLQIYR